MKSTLGFAGKRAGSDEGRMNESSKSKQYCLNYVLIDAVAADDAASIDTMNI